MNKKPGCGCGGSASSSVQSTPDDVRQFLDSQVRRRVAASPRKSTRAIDELVNEAAPAERDRPVTRMGQVRAEGPDGTPLPPIF